MYFFAVIGTVFAELVQYATPGRIEQVCGILSDYPGDSLQKLATLLRQVYQGACIGDYDDLRDVLNSTEVPALPSKSGFAFGCLSKWMKNLEFFSQLVLGNTKPARSSVGTKQPRKKFSMRHGSWTIS